MHMRQRVLKLPCEGAGRPGPSWRCHTSPSTQTHTHGDDFSVALTAPMAPERAPRHRIGPQRSTGEEANAASRTPPTIPADGPSAALLVVEPLEGSGRPRPCRLRGYQALRPRFCCVPPACFLDYFLHVLPLSLEASSAGLPRGSRVVCPPDALRHEAPEVSMDDFAASQDRMQSLLHLLTQIGRLPVTRTLPRKTPAKPPESFSPSTPAPRLLKPSTPLPRMVSP